MIFKGQYLTYSEYKNLGGTLNITPFNLLEFESRRQIDKRTFNRLVNESEIPDEVKLCMYHLIERINDYTSTNQNINNVESENIDGYSVKYVSPAQISEVVISKNAELNDIIKTDLMGIIVNDEHILYVGVK